MKKHFIKVLLVACASLLVAACGNQSTIDRLPDGQGILTFNLDSFEFVRIAAGASGGSCAGIVSARAAGETITKDIEIYTFNPDGSPVGLIDIAVSAAPFTASSGAGVPTLAILDSGVDVSTATDPSSYATTTDQFGIKKLTVELDLTDDDGCDYFGQITVSSGTVSSDMDFLIHDAGDGVGPT